MIRQKIRKRIAVLNKRGALAMNDEDKTAVAETLIRISELENLLKQIKR